MGVFDLWALTRCLQDIWGVLGRHLGARLQALRSGPQVWRIRGLRRRRGNRRRCGDAEGDGRPGRRRRCGLRRVPEHSRYCVEGIPPRWDDHERRGMDGAAHDRHELDVDEGARSR